MTLILSGTSGLSDVDGTAATPAIRGTDANTGIFFGADIIGFAEGGAEVARFNADAQFVAAAGTASLPVITTTGDVNTGIFFPAADTIAFAEGGVEAMRINSSGNVGIGTSSISGKLSVDGSVYAGPGSASGVAYGFYPAGTYGSTGMFAPAANTVAFATSGGERMRIDSSGNVLVGTTSQLSGSERLAIVNSSNAMINVRNSGAVAGKFWNIQTDGSNTFYIYNNGNAGVYLSDGATSWSGSSDERLKNITGTIQGGLAKVASLRAVEFTWKSDDENKPQVGLIAQDVQAVLPEVVDTSPEGYLGVRYSETVPLLVAAIQEQQALITDLTARITALENK